MDKNLLMALAGEIAKTDTEFKEKVVRQFNELIDELIKATDDRRGSS